MKKGSPFSFTAMYTFLSKEFILSKVSEEEIFEKFGLPIKDGLFVSTIRDDRRPTCNFYRSKSGKLKMKDWAGYFHGDCFDLVMKLYHVSFNKALQIVASEFDLIDDPNDRIPKPMVVVPKAYSDIKVKRRRWEQPDLNFWLQFSITRPTLDLYKVSPVERVWLNNESIYAYKHSDPAYVYHFSGYDYQIYFPFRKDFRFMTNNGQLVHGLEQLPQTGELCLITKSRKDIMCLREFNIPAVCSMAESIILKPKIVEDIKKRFKYVVSLMDYDNTGIHNAWTLRKLHGIQPLFFTDGVWKRKKGYKGAKDFSDYVRLHNSVSVQTLIELIHERKFGSCWQEGNRIPPEGQ